MLGGQGAGDYDGCNRSVQGEGVYPGISAGGALSGCAR
jgi:hypothetical protein